MFPNISPEYINLVSILGSAGAFTCAFVAITRISIAYIQRYKDRELTIEIDGKKITFKGHTIEEESKLIKQLSNKTFKHKQLNKSDEE
jgi:hypothetical protein